MWSLVRGTLRARWSALVASTVVIVVGTAIVAANASLLDAGIRAGQDEVISLGAVFGGLTVMLMVTVVAVVFSLSLAPRRTEIALGRAVGVTPGQVRWLVTLEVLVLGVVGSATGLLGATFLTELIVSVVAGVGVVSEGFDAPTRWLPSAVAAATGVLASLAAGLVSVHRWARLSPAEGLAQRNDESGHLPVARAVAAGLVATGAVALSLVTLLVMRGPVASSTAAPAVFVWTGGLALAAPVLVRPLVVVLSPLVSAAGVPGRVAADGARARVGAAAPVATAVMLAAGAALSLVTMQRATDAAAGAAAQPDVGGVVNYLLTGLIVAYATISFANAVALWALGRRREAAVCRALGATSLQTGAALLLEALIAVVSGLLLGLAVAAVTLSPFLVALRGTLDVPHGTWGLLGTIVGATLLLATVIGGAVVARTVRQPLGPSLVWG